MMSCTSCGTTVLLSDEAVKLAGEQGVMHDGPALFGIGDTIHIGKESVEILGHARYSYGRGYWDEYWGLTARGEPRWVSVDEGDIVLQAPIPPANTPTTDPPYRVGQVLTHSSQRYDITELDQAECMALRGTFDEELHVGETYRFVNAQAPDGGLLSGEFWGTEASWFVGEWVDPFEVRVSEGAK